jgi:hypothetical protein
MDKLWQLIIILLVIIILSVLADGIHFETFAEDKLTRVSNDIASLGVNLFASNPNSSLKSSITLEANKMDVLQSGLVKPEVSKGLVLSESLDYRACTEPTDDNSLQLSFNSNPTNTCGLTIDLQKYRLLATTIPITLITDATYENKLAIVPDNNFVKFLLLRPIVFTINNSVPYTIAYDKLLYTTFNISNVSKFNKDMSTIFLMPIKQPPRTQSTFFLPNRPTLSTVMRNSMNQIKNKGSSTSTIIYNFDVYYIKRDDSINGNKVKLPNKTITTKLNDNAYFENIFNTYRSTKQPRSLLSNPTFSVSFKLGINSASPWWMNNWIHIMSVSSAPTNTCNLAGRGILLVESRPASARLQGNPPDFVESKPNNPKFVCLDFTNVEEISQNRFDNCGNMNRNILWIPADTEVDIICIISASMKIVAAKFTYEGKKHLIFTHMYMPYTNAILHTIQSSKDIHVTNLALLNKIHEMTIKVSDVEVSYGVADLYKWFS